MLGACGWAFVKSMRKLYYNMTITCVSAVVALAVGERKHLRLSAGQLHQMGGSWIVAARLKERSGELRMRLYASLFWV
jgi:high-affinity nickel-transport protein